MRRSRGIAGSEAPALEVSRMRRRHLRGVMAIERQVYARPWSPSLFAAEIADPSNRCYLVARVYQEVSEDALIMWTDDVRTEAYRSRLDEIGSGLPEAVPKA